MVSQSTLASAEPSREVADPGRARAADQVHSEDRTHGGLAERERRGEQAKAKVVVDRDEPAHDQKGFLKKPRQAGVTKVPKEGARDLLPAKRVWDEVS